MSDKYYNCSGSQKIIFSWCFVPAHDALYIQITSSHSALTKLPVTGVLRRVFSNVEVISFLPVCLLLFSEMNYVYFVLYCCFFIISGLPVKPLFLLCICRSPAKPTFWFGPIWGCAGYD